jgi:hypothetical protein
MPRTPGARRLADLSRRGLGGQSQWNSGSASLDAACSAGAIRDRSRRRSRDDHDEDRALHVPRASAAFRA